MLREKSEFDNEVENKECASAPAQFPGYSPRASRSEVDDKTQKIEIVRKSGLLHSDTTELSLTRGNCLAWVMSLTSSH